MCQPQQHKHSLLLELQLIQCFYQILLLTEKNNFRLVHVCMQYIKSNKRSRIFRGGGGLRIFKFVLYNNNRQLKELYKSNIPNVSLMSCKKLPLAQNCRAISICILTVSALFLCVGLSKSSFSREARYSIPFLPNL